MHTGVQSAFQVNRLLLIVGRCNVRTHHLLVLCCFRPLEQTFPEGKAFLEALRSHRRHRYRHHHYGRL